MKKPAQRETRSFEDMKALCATMTIQDMDHACKTIRTILKYLLRMWEQDLGDRPLSLKRSGEGKRALAIFKQNEQYIKPLLKLLKKRVRNNKKKNKRKKEEEEEEEEEETRKGDDQEETAEGETEKEGGERERERGRERECVCV